MLVVGAGPGGIAAARRLRDHGEGRVDVVLVTREGRATHLAGTVPAALGERPAAEFSVPVAMRGVACVAGEVTAVRAGGAVVDGEEIAADAVIAAPGLAADAGAVPDWARACAGWDPAAGEAAAPRLRGVAGRRLVIAVCGVPYRCPPAPYGLAMALARAHRAAGDMTRVVVATPEAFPLIGIGGEAPAFLMESCAGAGVQLEGRFAVDLDGSEDGVLRARDGRELPYQLAFVVPPHRRAPMLDGLAGDGPLVRVDAHGESSEPGVFVVGDAAASALPRAAGVAAAQGETAADAALARLGLAEAAPPAVPEPGCYVAHGGGAWSRIAVSYPDGLPPAAEGRVRIDAPTPDLALAAEGERRRFLRAASGD